MAIKVILQNPSQPRVATHDRSGDEHIGMNRVVYQLLGSLVKNRKLEDSYNSDELPGVYRDMLDQFNNMTFNNKGVGTPLDVKPGFKELDTYLGALGITRDYPYVKDIIDIPPWVNELNQTEYRVLMDFSDNTYLTDTANNILVVYTNR